MEIEETCILLEQQDVPRMISRRSSCTNQEFWDFVTPWLRDWKHDWAQHKNTYTVKKLNKLWTVLTEWVTKCNSGREPNDVVAIMGQDRIMRENFSRYYAQYAGFRRNVDTLFGFAPIFDAHMLQEAGIEPWSIDEDRQTFIQRVRQQHPAVEKIPDNSSPEQRPAYAPPCTFWHDPAFDPIPLDWPHALSMIARIRDNLNGQSKTAVKSADTRMLAPAYNILLDMWRQELPAPMRSVLPLRLPWFRILVRSGFLVYPIDELRVSLSDESERNIAYLAKILDKGGFGQLEGKICRFNESEIDQGDWLETVETLTLGRRRGPDGGDFDDLEILDTHMAGLVRWLNVIGIRTAFCCDGHSRGRAYVSCNIHAEARLAGGLVFLSGLLGESVTHEGHDAILIPRAGSLESGTRSHVRQLLDVAEWLYDNRERLAYLLPSLRHSLPWPPFEPTFKLQHSV